MSRSCAFPGYKDHLPKKKLDNSVHLQAAHALMFLRPEISKSLPPLTPDSMLRELDTTRQVRSDQDDIMPVKTAISHVLGRTLELFTNIDLRGRGESVSLSIPYFISTYLFPSSFFFGLLAT